MKLDLPVPRESKVLLEKLDLLGQQARRDHRETLVPLELPAILGLQVPRVKLARQDRKVLLVHRVSKASRVWQATQGLLVHKERLVTPDLLDLRVRLGPQATLVLLVHRARLDPQAHKVFKVRLVLQVTLAPSDRQVLRGSRVSLETQAPPVLLELQETQVLPVLKV